MRVRLETPAGFSFARTVLSHGWCRLPPFVLERGAASLATTVAQPEGGARAIVLTGDRGEAFLDSPGAVPPSERRRLVAASRRILNLDLDLTGFHRMAATSPGLEWIAQTGAGRLLRSPTLFEDLVKLVLTTNCSFALTTRMTGSLVARYGEVAADGSRSFPTAPRLAAVPPAEWSDRVRAGYRAPYLAALAGKVAAGEVDPDAWEHDHRDVGELRRDLLSLPGVGPYVAENLLKLIGRPRGLALDSWMRAKYADLHHGGRRVTDRTIARRFARLGDWGGMALWLELTRDWFEGDGPATAWETLS